MRLLHQFTSQQTKTTRYESIFMLCSTGIFDKTIDRIFIHFPNMFPKQLLYSNLFSALLVCPMFANTAEVSNLDQHAFRWAQITIKRDPDKAIDAKSISILDKAIKVDKRFSEAEKQLVNILQGAKYTEIKISALKSSTFNPSDIVLKRKFLLRL